jgi:hypothetical protein
MQYSIDFAPGRASHRSEQWAFQNGVFPNKAMASKDFMLHTPF